MASICVAPSVFSAALASAESEMEASSRAPTKTLASELGFYPWWQSKVYVYIYIYVQRCIYIHMYIISMYAYGITHSIDWIFCTALYVYLNVWVILSNRLCVVTYNLYFQNGTQEVVNHITKSSGIIPSHEPKALHVFKMCEIQSAINGVHQTPLKVVATPSFFGGFSICFF